MEGQKEKLEEEEMNKNNNNGLEKSAIEERIHKMERAYGCLLYTSRCV